jgi:uncharacterized protein
MPPNSPLPRRDFVRTAAAGLAAGLGIGADADSGTNGDAIPMRSLGKTGAKVSALGIGGHHLGDAPDVETAIEIVHAAVDAGVTLFDNCWEYWNGRAEDWLGRGLKGRRDKVFLMTKVCTHGRGADLAMKMLDQSLRRLLTDHLDLWQIHGVCFDNDPELAYAKGGVLEALDAAKKAGKARFVGFTGHKEPAIHLKMIEMGYPFDSVQMPLNVFDASYHSFERAVLPELHKRGIAALGMKPMGGTADGIKRGVVTAEEMLRYAMSLPVATTISGNDSMDVLQKNLKVARGFKPLSESEMQALREKCAPASRDGRFELYKVSLRFDNPQAREAHGFPDDPTVKEIKEEFKTAGYRE